MDHLWSFNLNENCIVHNLKVVWSILLFIYALLNAMFNVMMSHDILTAGVIVLE